MNIFIHRHIGFFIALFCSFWLIFIYLRLPHLFWQPAILFSWFISKGLIIYKDFLDFYFPLATFIVFPLYSFLGWKTEIEPFLSLIIAIITLLVLYSFSRRYLSQVTTAVVLIFFTFLFYYFTTSIQYCLEAVIGLLMVILLFQTFSLMKSKKTSKPTIFTLGMLVSITELFGQIATLTLLFISAVIFYFLYIKKPPKRSFLESILLFLIGTTIPLSLISIYFLLHGALKEFFESNVTYYFTYLRLANEKSSLANLPWRDIIYFYLPIVIAIFAILFKRATLAKSKINLYLPFVLLVSITTIPSVIFSVFHPHHFLYALPILALLLGLSIETIIIYKTHWGKYFLLIILLSFSYFFFSAVLPWYWQRIIIPHKDGVVNDIFPDDDIYSALIWIKSNTKENDKILVAGDGMFYLRSNRLPSSRYHVVLPWHYLPLEKTSSEIRNHRPDYWIIGQTYLARLNSVEGWNSPEITNFIRQDLNICYQKIIELSNWEIWRKICQ